MLNHLFRTVFASQKVRNTGALSETHLLRANCQVAARDCAEHVEWGMNQDLHGHLCAARFDSVHLFFVYMLRHTRLGDVSLDLRPLQHFLPSMESLEPLKHLSLP